MSIEWQSAGIRARFLDRDGRPSVVIRRFAIYGTTTLSPSTAPRSITTIIRFGGPSARAAQIGPNIGEALAPSAALPDSLTKSRLNMNRAPICACNRGGDRRE